MSQVWTSQVWIMFTWNIKKIAFFFIVVLDLVQLKQELVGFLVLLHGYYFFVLLFCSFFNISFLGVIGLLLQFVFYIIDFFAVFVLFVDCAFYSWIILIVSVFCNGICWLIMVFVNFVVLFFWAFYCLNEKLLFLLMLPLEWESLMPFDWVLVYKYLKLLMEK